MKSDIGPSWSEVLPDVKLWAIKMAELARSKLVGSISANLRAYRYNGIEYLAVEMIGQHAGSMSVTIAAGAVSPDYGLGDLECSCFDVADMTEALTMVSLFLRDTNADVSVGSF
ncbi:hypothetical protein [Pseudomonas amygdali]|uniref:hypothetical protein n=1 Tax=Pseudomonas amygdali TaxID=47877 RepID=UPI000379FD7F|nr:hypothetical protein [Pseudomonas amygdali]KEZ27521.1 hypothetical protein A3SK_0109575 [Pseudomonas amygdali pv. tabaci str. 6605]KIY19322.1 hypothetical protein RD00_07215 [Pseudomonas amygdali pv. tabaci]BCS46585.1 hypothetical protein Pta6605_49160 [Pseudomonas amygdali pv. tabaci]